MKLIKNKKIRVLVTGGPTRAYLDKVRYLSNLSTGALAFVLCDKLCKAGVEVAAVCGPTSFSFETLGLRKYEAVETNVEMLDSVLQLCKSFRPTHAIFAAAVLDFVPQRQRLGKVSSKISSWPVILKPAPKIIDEVQRRFPGIHRIGFKLEYSKGNKNVIDRMGEKILRDKELDALVLNFLLDVGKKQHRAYLFSRRGPQRCVSTKAQIATWLTRHVLK